MRENQLIHVCSYDMEEFVGREKLVIFKKIFSIHKTKIMASGPITSWQIDGETMETVTDFILEGSTHSSILAWKIPWTKESGSLLSMGLQRVGHD